AAITNKSNYADEAFEFIKILIDNDLPYSNELNPFEKRHRSKCGNIPEGYLKEFCNSLLQFDGTFPYYYSHNNSTKIVYMTHIESEDGNRGIIINSKNLKNTVIGDNGLENKSFMCGFRSNFQSQTITYYNEYEIELPLNEKEKIILKSTIDMYENNDLKQQLPETVCEIYEISKLQQKSPIGLLFAHLYYKHNTTEEGSFEDVLNECCDVIDDALYPYCNYANNITFSFGECIGKNNTRKVKYHNCRIDDDEDKKFLTFIQCSYILQLNIKGLFVKVICIYLSGLGFLLSFVITSILLELSMIYWVGPIKKRKCIIGIFLVILSNI
ncbi:hypothetical protein PIROE2DRAFT_18272, partial [Piromyces sp. E2]